MNINLTTHLLRAIIIAIVANLSQLIITELFFFLGMQADLGLGVIFLIPFIYLFTLVTIYFVCLKIVTLGTYKSPKKLSLLLTLFSIPLFITRELGFMTFNDIGPLATEQVSNIPLTLIVGGVITFILWAFRQR